MSDNNSDSDSSSDEELVWQRAARIRDAAYIYSLIAQGNDVNARDGDGYSPLHFATFAGRLNAVDMLIRHGARVDATNDWGMTSLHFASKLGWLAVAACLIDHGADVNAQTDDGSTCFTMARFWDHDDVARLLIWKGAVDVFGDGEPLDEEDEFERGAESG